MEKKNQLIPVFTGSIGNTTTQLVNARDLHQFLGVKRDFSNWIKQRIDHFGFVEGEDFIALKQGESKSLINNLAKKGELTNQHLTKTTTEGDRIDYHLTVDMSKELGMVERSEKGRQIRRYFLDIEKQAQAPKALHSPVEAEALARWEAHCKANNVPDRTRQEGLLTLQGLSPALLGKPPKPTPVPPGVYPNPPKPPKGVDWRWKWVKDPDGDAELQQKLDSWWRHQSLQGHTNEQKVRGRWEIMYTEGFLEKAY